MYGELDEPRIEALVWPSGEVERDREQWKPTGPVERHEPNGLVFAAPDSQTSMLIRSKIRAARDQTNVDRAEPFLGDSDHLGSRVELNGTIV